MTAAASGMCWNGRSPAASPSTTPSFFQSRINGMGLFKPPYGKLFERMVNLLIR